LAAANTARTQLQSGTAFAQIGKDLKVAVDPAKFVGRGDPSVPAEILSVAFDAPKPVQGPVYQAVPLQNGGAALVAVTKIRSGAQTNKYLEQALQQQEVQRNGDAAARGYVAELRATSKVSKNPDAFQ